MRISKREQVLLLVLVILLSFYIFYISFYQPIKKDIVKLTAENAKMQGLIENEKGKAERAREWENKKSEIKANYVQMKLKLPDQASIPEVISSLAQSAEDSNVNLQSISYYYREDNSYSNNLQIEDSTIKTCDFEIIANGSYYNLLLLLSKIEDAPRIYVINSLELNMMKTKGQVMLDPLSINHGMPDLTDIEQEKTSQQSDNGKLALRLHLTTYYDPFLVLDIDSLSGFSANSLK
ncbi:MAG: type 4a pilus biogenesis protein PilO [Syntrophomonadaceae bacterium]|jgi:Tfp pilus assembly protein PilO